MNRNRKKSFNDRERPKENYKSGSTCKKVSQKFAYFLTSPKNKDINLNGSSDMSNFLSYLALKAESKKVIIKTISILEEKLTKHSHAEAILYGFKHAIEPKLPKTLNTGLSKLDLKQPTNNMYQATTPHIRSYIEMRTKEGEVNEIENDQCISVYTGAMLPYFDHISHDSIYKYVISVLDAAKKGDDPTDRPKNIEL